MSLRWRNYIASIRWRLISQSELWQYCTNTHTPSNWNSFAFIVAAGAGKINNKAVTASFHPTTNPDNVKNAQSTKCSKMRHFLHLKFSGKSHLTIRENRRYVYGQGQVKVRSNEVKFWTWYFCIKRVFIRCSSPGGIQWWSLFSAKWSKTAKNQLWKFDVITLKYIFRHNYATKWAIKLKFGMPIVNNELYDIYSVFLNVENFGI